MEDPGTFGEYLLIDGIWDGSIHTYLGNWTIPTKFQSHFSAGGKKSLMFKNANDNSSLFLCSISSDFTFVNPTLWLQKKT